MVVVVVVRVLVFAGGGDDSLVRSITFGFVRVKTEDILQQQKKVGVTAREGETLLSMTECISYFSANRNLAQKNE